MSGKTKQAGCDASHKLLAGTVHDLEFLLLVKGEDRNINFHQHFFEQGRGFQRADLLLLHAVSKVVQLKGEIGERVVTAASTHAKREVFFADGGHHVGQGLQGTDDVALKDGAAYQPANQEDEGDGPLEFDGIGTNQKQ